MKRLLFLLLIPCLSLNAQEWTEFAFYIDLVTSSSNLPDPNQDEEEWFINKRYGSQNLVDGNNATAWVEGAEGSGVGEFIYFVLPDSSRFINVYNGYCKSKSLWEQNNRVKRMKVTYHVGINAEGFVTEIADVYKALQFPSEFYIDLEDAISLQTFLIPFNDADLKTFGQQVVEGFNREYDIPIRKIYNILRFEIVDVYKGTKYDDTCISEFYFRSEYSPDYQKSVYDNVEKVYIDPTNDSRVLIDTPLQRGIMLLEDNDSVLQISEVSSDNVWVTIIRMPKELGVGRTETEYLLLNTRLSRVMNKDIEKLTGKQLYGPFFINNQGGETVLEYIDGEFLIR